MFIKKTFAIRWLKDSLHNFHPRSGASDDYCQGLLVGVVSALMGSGSSFDDAIHLVASAMPEEPRMPLPAPEGWVADLENALAIYQPKFMHKIGPVPCHQPSKK